MDITKLEKGDFMNTINDVIIFATVLTVIGFILQGILKYMDKKDLDNLKFDSTYSKEERQYIINQFKISIEMTKNYKELCKIEQKK